MVKRVQLIIVVTIAIIGLLIAFLDTVGLLGAAKTDYPFLGGLINNIQVIIISLIAIELIWERFSTLNEMDSVLKKINGEELFEKLNKADRILKKADERDVLVKFDQVYDSFLSLERRFSQVNAFFYVLEKNEKFQYLALKYGLRQLSRIIDEGTVRIREEETLNVWRECILESKDWYALSYAKDAWGIGQGFGDMISHDYQRLRMETQGDIRRVFVLDNEKEYADLLPVMRSQEDIKVKVKWIMRSDLSILPAIQNCINELGTWDFSLVDNQKWLFLFNLDNRGCIDGCTITINTHAVEQANRVYQEAWARGRVPNISPT